MRQNRLRETAINDSALSNCLVSDKEYRAVLLARPEATADSISAKVFAVAFESQFVTNPTLLQTLLQELSKGWISSFFLPLKPPFQEHDLCNITSKKF